ncbi:MAG: hypothetical protein WCB79_09395 [Halobacteriota archaeon]
MRSFSAIDRKKEKGTMVGQKDVLGVARNVANTGEMKWITNLGIPLAIACLLSRWVGVAI